MPGLEDGLREAVPSDNRAVTSAKEVPRRLLMLGGGAIGAEMAQAFKRLGNENVVVLAGAARLLAREEPFVGDDRRTVVGATFTGPGVQELLHSATVAICAGVTVDRLCHAVPSFPTISEVWLHLLEAYGL